MHIRKTRTTFVPGPSQKHDKQFYQKVGWRVRRAGKLKMNPLCEECQREGRHVVGNVVDHIIPRSMGGADYDWNNLQTLCYEHHNKKTRLEQLGAKKTGY